MTSIARRIADGATNLFVTGILIVAGVTLGREAIHWWRVTPESLMEQSIPNAPHSPSDRELQQIQFGEHAATFQRVVVAGDRQQALTALKQYARPQKLPRDSALPPLGEAETSALAAIADMKPIAEEPGVWQMYQLDAPLPMAMVVGVDRRVLSWAIAFPRAPAAEDRVEAWTIFTWSPVGPGAKPDQIARLPEFPGGRKTLSLNSPNGSGLVLVQGPGPLSAWRLAVDRWVQSQKMIVVREWTELGGVWTLRLQTDPKTEQEIELAHAGSSNQVRAMIEVRVSQNVGR